jgi:hypothetical protein
VAESTQEKGRTRQTKRTQRILQAAGETVLPEVLEQPRNNSIAVGECVNEQRNQHKASVIGEDVEDCRGHQAVARRKRSIRNLGDPTISRGMYTGRKQNRKSGKEPDVLWGVGSAHSTLRQGKPVTRLRRAPAMQKGMGKGLTVVRSL